MKAGAAELPCFFNQCDSKSEFCAADCRRVTRRAAAYDCNVENRVCQENSILRRILVDPEKVIFQAY
jgi:hypothetical protein